MFNLFSKSICDIYYYKCGVNNTTIMTDCTKSQTGFKDFDKPEEYGNITHIALNKETAEREHTNRPPIGLSGVGQAFWWLTADNKVETGEARILSSELGTNMYTIIEK